MRRHPDDFWRDIEKLPATVDGQKYQAYPKVRDGDPDVYDYIAEYRKGQRTRRVVLHAGVILGLLVGLGILIFAVVR